MTLLISPRPQDTQARYATRVLRGWRAAHGRKRRGGWKIEEARRNRVAKAPKLTREQELAEIAAFIAEHGVTEVPPGESGL